MLRKKQEYQFLKRISESSVHVKRINFEKGLLDVVTGAVPLTTEGNFSKKVYSDF